MDLADYKKQFTEDDSVGWMSIDTALEKIYAAQEPKHFAPPLHYQLGGEDPLDGISIYQSKVQTPHHHFISYGFSELYYDEESAGADFSRWGFELTFRLAPFVDDNDPPTWPIAVMQNLARYVFNNKKWFEEFHFIPMNGPIRLETDTQITAVAFVLDPELGKIDTPHGEVCFLQMVGITQAEYDALKVVNTLEATEQLLEKFKQTNSLLITDISRKS
jgi:Suppressor of fused protein (SUFU)